MNGVPGPYANMGDAFFLTILRHLQGGPRIQLCIPQVDTVILNYGSIYLEITPKTQSYRTAPHPHSHTHMHTQIAAASGKPTLLLVLLTNCLWVRGFRGHFLGFN